ncbi:hypothetical protein ACFX16_009642 [Malus domestica]
MRRLVTVEMVANKRINETAFIRRKCIDNMQLDLVDTNSEEGWLDPQGLKRKMKRELGKAIQIASKFFKERIQERDVGGEKTMDFLDVLLEFEGDGIDKLAKISDHDLIIFILVSSLFSP